MKRYFKFYNSCKIGGCIFFIVVLRNIIFRLRGYNIYSHRKVKIKGLTNMHLGGSLRIGINYLSFSDSRDKTYLNIRGKFITKGNYSIGRGCRIAVAADAVLEIGEHGYSNGEVLIKAENHIKIGSDCAIAWGCQIIDEDFHQIKYQGYKEKEKSVIIGDHVWIGSRVCIYSGTKIPNNTVIAANSVVRDVFTEENTLIAGNPARVIKQGVEWS